MLFILAISSLDFSLCSQQTVKFGHPCLRNLAFQAGLPTTKTLRSSFFPPLLIILISSYQPPYPVMFCGVFKWVVNHFQWLIYHNRLSRVSESVKELNWSSFLLWEPEVVHPSIPINHLTTTKYMVEWWRQLAKLDQQHWDKIIKFLLEQRLFSFHTEQLIWSEIGLLILAYYYEPNQVKGSTKTLCFNR